MTADRSAPAAGARPSVSRCRRRGLALDLLVGLAVFAAGTALGVHYLRGFGWSDPLHKVFFAPAVMLACGHGFQNVDSHPIAPLEAFLNARSNTFSCAQLPARVTGLPLFGEQGGNLYLQVLVGLVWRATGISWTGLDPLLGTMFGITSALVYGVLRLLLRRVPAVLGAVLCTVSLNQLTNLPYIRDYSKAPFALALVLLLGLLVRGPVTTRRMLLWAGLFGAVLGVGVGFREDLIATVPPFLAVVFLFSAVPVRDLLGVKAIAVAVATLAFGVLSLAALLANAGTGGNLLHVFLLGFQGPVDPELGVAGPLYAHGAVFADHAVVAQVQDHASRLLGGSDLVSINPDSVRPAYAAAVTDYVLATVGTFPADVLVRAYAAMLRVLDLGFQDRPDTSLYPVRHYPTYASAGITGKVAVSLYSARSQVLDGLRGLGPWLVLGDLLLLAAAGRHRVAIFLACFVAYFGALPMLQFHPRHYFYLEFITWAAALFAVQCLAVGAGRLAVARTRSRSLSAGLAGGLRAAPRVLMRPALFAAALAIALSAPLLAARAYQAPRVDALLAGYLSADLVPLPLAFGPSPADPGDVLDPVTLPGSDWQRLRIDGTGLVGQDRTELLEVVLDPARCGPGPLRLGMRYAPDPTSHLPFVDFTSWLSVPASGQAGTTRVFAPVYEYSTPVLDYWTPGWYSRFAGVELPREQAACVLGISRVAGLGRTPFLLTATLPPSWQRLQPYEVFAPGSPLSGR